MNREQLFEAIGDIDDRFIIEAEHTPPVTRKWSIYLRIAACLVLILTVGLVGYLCQTGTSSVVPTVKASSPFFYPTKQSSSYVVNYPKEEDRIVVTSASRYLFVTYARSPHPGECRLDICEPAITSDTKQAVDPNVVYWVEICLYDQDGHRIQSGEEKHAEAERLASLGYEIYLADVDWTGYWGEDKHYTYLCGYFTAEHLRHFPVSDRFGYSIDFVRLSEHINDPVFERVTPAENE